MPKKKQYEEERVNPFDQQPNDDIRTVDEAVYGKVDWDGGNRIVAKSLPIMQIEADVTQPRRIVPREVRGAWDGSPEGVPDMLDEWHDAVMDYVDDLPIEKILNGKMPPFGNEKNPYGSTGAVVVDEFLKLLDLAAQIKDVGLQQPIGVIALPKNHYRIIFGERRWMAFHVLAHWVDDKWSQIPSKVAELSAFDVAKIQAAENMQRVELNAIERARQFAKLVIEARRDNPETPYDKWNALVVPGGCDRPYWSMVHDGNIHPIPYGMGPIFEQTLGISTGQMRQYRALLQMFDDWDVDNALWDMGDEFNWAEQFMREIREFIDLDTVRTILKESPEPEETLREVIANEKEARRRMKAKARTVTTVTLLDEDEPEETPETLQTSVDKSQWASYAWVGKEADAGGVTVFVTNCTAPETVMVRYPMADGTVKEVPMNVFALQAIPAPTRGTDNADTAKGDVPVDKFGLPLMKGQTVKTRTGHTATVVSVQGRMIALESEQNKYLQRLHYPETLEIVQPDSNGAALAEGDMVMTDDGRGVGMIVEFISGNVARVETPIGVWAYGVPRLKRVEQKPNTLLHPPSPPKPAAQPDLEKSAYPDDLKGRRVGYDGEAAIIVAMAGEGKVYIQCGKSRLEVAVDKLDFNYPLPVTEPAKANVNGTRQGLVFAEDDAIRLYLMPYRALAVALEDEHATNAIEWLSGLTYERTNRKEMQAAMDHVLTHIETMNKTVEEIVFEQFRLKLDELN